VGQDAAEFSARGNIVLSISGGARLLPVGVHLLRQSILTGFVWLRELICHRNRLLSGAAVVSLRRAVRAGGPQQAATCCCCCYCQFYLLQRRPLLCKRLVSGREDARPPRTRSVTATSGHHAISAAAAAAALTEGAAAEGRHGGAQTLTSTRRLPSTCRVAQDVTSTRRHRRQLTD